MRSPFRLIFSVILFGLLAWFGMEVRRPQIVSELIWPAGGVLLGVLMLSERRQWPLWLLTTAALHTAVGAWAGRSFIEALIFPASQLVVAPLMAMVWRRQVTGTRTLADLHNLLWFLGLLVGGALVSSGIVSALFALTVAPLPPGNWITDVISSVVGGLIGVPVILAWMDWTAQRSGGATGSEFWQGLLWFALLAASTVLVFDSPTALAVLNSTRYELSYLPIMFLVLLAMQWDKRGLSFALLVLATIATLSTLDGEGPFVTPGERARTAILEVQVYLGAAALLGLLMAAITDGRNRALRQAAAMKVRFEAALGCSQHLAYEFDPSTGSILWGGEVNALLGLPAEALADRAQFFERVHPDDREQLTTLVQIYINRKQSGEIGPHTRRFRFLCGDGQYRHVVDTGAALPGMDDDVYLVSGLVQVLPSDDESAQGI